MPAVVKPTSSGSSVGVSLVKYYDELPAALGEAAKYDDSVIIEEYIPGIEATCGVVEGFRGQELYALPPVEIRPATEFFDYEAKYKGKSQEIVPATFSEKFKLEIEELARKIHRALGLRHYSRSDFIIHPRRGIYVLEVNTLPGLTEESLLPKALRAVGSDTNELIGHVLELSMGN
jgi:D-alanine-D-alanine ligase